MVDIAKKVVSESILITKLIENSELVGGIYSMGYEDCLVLTNDFWKNIAGGIPKHCFLLATTMRKDQVPELAEQEVILLRVEGPSALPQEAELLQVRADAMRQMVEEHGRDFAASEKEIVDVFTRNEIQFAAIKAKILGTFYEVEEGGKAYLAFGSDTDNIISGTKYKVYKPYGESLSYIVNQHILRAPAAGQDAMGSRENYVRIGTVRYSSTKRKRGGDTVIKPTNVPVLVNIDDFIANKSAVFGMTRQGKSNTMKTIATAVCKYAAETDQKIGQVLFDPAGEYANFNEQDKTALKDIGSDYVTVFRYGGDGSDPSVKPLSINFFDQNQINFGWETIKLVMRGDALYTTDFCNADILGPQDGDLNSSDYKRAMRRRAAVYAILMKVGLKPHERFRIPISVNKDVLATINSKAASGISFQSTGGNVVLDATNLENFWDAVVKAQDDGAQMQSASNDKPWIDTGLDAILKVYKGSRVAGYRRLSGLRIYHSPVQAKDFAENVLEELVKGKIVIIDLSRGADDIHRFCSERILTYIFDAAAKRFTEGEPARKIQIFLEEAHRFFERDELLKKNSTDPYVRLAKEAAKYKIGLIYATQEVSSVDSSILSNTSNWIVTHLNNQDEVRELGKYYDFDTFKDIIIKAEDPGFARIKTKSGRYIIPTQIDLFNKDRVDEARQACEAAKERAEGDAKVAAIPEA